MDQRLAGGDDRWDDEVAAPLLLKMRRANALSNEATCAVNYRHSTG